jgi:hypothetical protein
MSTTNRKVRSGNRTFVIFDGKRIGMIQSVRMDDNYNLEPASGIGDAHVQEHVPGLAQHSLSVSGMVLIKGSMLEAGIVPENVDAALQGLVFDFESYDDAGTLLRKYTKVSYGSGGIDIQAHRILVQNAQFMACDVTGTGA